ncbi:unnamed protein product [Rotaria sp. Silwood2]|nr:unnamed protein product [Rotaria sp. Silwood2]
MESDRLFFILFGTLYTIVVLLTAIFSLVMLTTIIYHWHPHCRSTSNLLTCNSCVAFLFFNITIAIQIPNLFQAQQQQLTNNLVTPSCRIRAFLFLFACIVKIFSYLIQAISRYFTIILYKRKILLTYRTNILLILFSWICSLVLGSSMFISPVAFQYEPESYLCVFTTKVFHTSFTLMIVAFLLPVNIIVLLYGIILRHTTRTNVIHVENVLRNNNKRNIKVFRNILMVVVVLIVGGTPNLISIIVNPICCPLRTRRTFRRVRRIITLCWLSSLITAIPQLFIFEQSLISGSLTKYHCASTGYTAEWQRRVYFTTFACYVLVIPAFCMTICYIKIIRVVASSTNAWMQKVQDQTTTTILPSPPAALAKIKTVQLAMAIIIVFVVCWTPYMVITLVVIYSNGFVRIPSWLDGVLQTICLAQSSLNPFIYIIFNKRRKHPPTIVLALARTSMQISRRRIQRK